MRFPIKIHPSLSLLSSLHHSSTFTLRSSYPVPLPQLDLSLQLRPRPQQSSFRRTRQATTQAQVEAISKPWESLPGVISCKIWLVSGRGSRNRPAGSVWMARLPPAILPGSCHHSWGDVCPSTTLRHPLEKDATRSSNVQMLKRSRLWTLSWVRLAFPGLALDPPSDIAPAAEGAGATL